MSDQNLLAKLAVEIQQEVKLLDAETLEISAKSSPDASLPYLSAMITLNALSKAIMRSSF